ncbi:hypothetical protein [Phytohabitans houttuyneae]|uniref:Uncharacterized protein n=1 Tax=Phytohabitans houttuyneae TaxID=1076126 RepID=A0A6V8KHP6_9ACTN|nr:hypothetical protein [Phytohabitans houttuyneae]GFJ81991.1 hypothetical protein Phou_061710 [Phytohabitans houttuyneae]
MVLLTDPRPAAHPGDIVADLVADIVATTRRGTAVYSRNRFHAPWASTWPAGTSRASTW